MKIVNIFFSLITLLFLVACSEDNNTMVQPESMPVSENNPYLRVIHSSYDAPAVDITLTDGTIVFGNVAFKNYSDLLPLDVGTYDLQVGTDTVLLELNGTNLTNGNIYERHLT